MALFQTSLERFQQSQSQLGAERQKKHWLEDRTLKLRIEKHKGELRIYEYLNGKKRTSLQYPPSKGRGYYKVGDMVLVKSTTRQWLGRIFPELEAEEEGVMPYLDMLMYFIADEPPATYQYAFKIERMQLSSFSKGKIVLRGLLLLPEGAVELKSRQEVSLQRLNIRFIDSAHDQGLAFVQHAAFTLCNTTVNVLPYGLFRRGPLVLAKQLSRGFLKRNLFRKLKREINRILLKSLVATVTATITELARQIQRSHLSKQASKKEVEIAFKKAIAPAVEKGMTVLFTGLFQREAKPFLNSVMKAYDKVSGGAGQSFVASLRRYLYQQMYQILSVDLFETLVQFHLTILRETLVEGELRFRLGKFLSDTLIRLMNKKINQALGDSLKQSQLDYFKNQR